MEDLIDLGPNDNIALDDPSDEKCTITVEYEGKQTIVSWYNGLGADDVKEAIVCACDCIIDSGFSLANSDGFLVDFSQVKSGEKYFIKPGEEIKGYEKALGDRWRRINLDIEALQHAESMRAIEIMQNGANLLKHTRRSMPHIRMFQLTPDLKYLIWYTSAKSQTKSSVPFQHVTQISIGQTTPNFGRYPLPVLSHLSFSLFYDGKTLDLTCRDEREFDFWVAGCKALYFHYQNMPVSKQILLGHSRRFNEFLQANKLGLATSSLYQEPETKKLEECIIRKRLTRQEASNKLLKNREKITSLEDTIRDLPEIESPMMNKMPSRGAFSSDYVEVLLEDEGMDEVYNTQETRMHELLKSCKDRIEALEKEFSNMYGVPAWDENKEFDSNLWKLEVDVENLNDIVKRMEELAKPKLTDRVKSWFKSKVSFF